MKAVMIRTSFRYIGIDSCARFRCFNSCGNPVGTFFSKETDAKTWANNNGYKVVENFGSDLTKKLDK